MVCRGRILISPRLLVNIFSDVFIICLPISQVARLKMPSRQKWGVISVFLLGGLVVITSSTLPPVSNPPFISFHP